MQWKNLFIPVANLSALEAREFMAARSPKEYQLLDVRQPKEYELEHIPGGRLIPLGELGERLAELEPESPVIVYCAVGGRSRAAAQYLAGRGFSKVYNLAGGIKAWSASKAVGGWDEGLELLSVDADYPDALLLAHAMEAGLQGFYLTLADGAPDATRQRFFHRLAGFEEQHMARLVAEHLAQTGQPVASFSSPVLEGGARGAELARRLAPDAGAMEILEFAMALEAQAFDLYSRMAGKVTNPASRTLFLGMMEEEHAHLTLLTREHDKQTSGGTNG